MSLFGGASTPCWRVRTMSNGATEVILFHRGCWGLFDPSFINFRKRNKTKKRSLLQGIGNLRFDFLQIRFDTAHRLPVVFPTLLKVFTRLVFSFSSNVLRFSWHVYLRRYKTFHSISETWRIWNCLVKDFWNLYKIDPFSVKYLSVDGWIPHYNGVW